MSQTKRGSIFEAIANVAIGATISFIAQMLIFPLYGFTPTTQQDFAILGWFTFISIVRSYCGTWRTYLAELRSHGWVVGQRDQMQITSAGIAALGVYSPLPTGHALIEYWRARLGQSGKRAIFDVLVGAYPRPVSTSKVSEITGISTSGGTWRTYLAELRRLDLVVGKGELKASDDLFETRT